MNPGPPRDPSGNPRHHSMVSPGMPRVQRMRCPAWSVRPHMATCTPSRPSLSTDISTSILSVLTAPSDTLALISDVRAATRPPGPPAGRTRSRSRIPESSCPSPRVTRMGWMAIWYDGAGSTIPSGVITAAPSGALNPPGRCLTSATSTSRGFTCLSMWRERELEISSSAVTGAARTTCPEPKSTAPLARRCEVGDLTVSSRGSALLLARDVSGWGRPSPTPTLASTWRAVPSAA
mmetsp:Transcript_32492/g.103472  ORF Transcript_32492/g.103472 Transcript_32492/m.103472 type:complete len:235 (+) Transcript_32492:557-1261(+)